MRLIVLSLFPVGRPIHVVKNINPTAEEIDKLHQEFIVQLVDLFEANKHRYLEDADNIHLVIS